MATIIKNDQDYGTLGVTTELDGMIVTQANRRKVAQTKEIIGPAGDVLSFAIFNQKTEVTLDGFISGTYDRTIGQTISASETTTFIDSISRSFSAEDVAKLTISATVYAGLQA